MEEKYKLEFEKALELRNFEISNFWIRCWFFGALILAAVSGYYTNVTATKQIFQPVCISFLIFLFSFFQSLMNRGSKYWQERWEFITKNRETELGINLTKTNKYNYSERYYLDRCILAKNENILVRGERFSVTKIAFLVWDIICITSLFLWINDIIKITSFEKIDITLTFKIIGFHSVLITYILFFWFKNGYVYENITKTTKDVNKKRRSSEHQKDCDDYVENKIDLKA